MPDTPLFSWIHLTDIHFGQGAGPGRRDPSHAAERPAVLGLLIEDIVKLIGSGAPAPDALFVTGDIAESGREEEYKGADAWLRKLLDQTHLSADRGYVVAGNHDVERKDQEWFESFRPAVDNAKNAAHNILDSTLDLVDKGDISATDSLRRLKERQRSFMRFVERYDAKKAGALYWTDVVQARCGLSIRIFGLNTALLAGGGDKGLLELGVVQLGTVLEGKCELNQVGIALMHHPLEGGWLADQDEAARWIRSSSHIQLSGHVHASIARRVYEATGNDYLAIHGGASHGDKAPDGYPAGYRYNVAAIYADDDGRIFVRVWPRRWFDGSKTFGPDDENLGEANTLPRQIYLDHLPPFRGVRLPNSARPQANAAKSMKWKPSWRRLIAAFGTTALIGLSLVMKGCPTPASRNEPHVRTVNGKLFASELPPGFPRSGLLYVRARTLPSTNRIAIVRVVDPATREVAWHCRPTIDVKSDLEGAGLRIDAVQADTIVRVGSCWGAFRAEDDKDWPGDWQPIPLVISLGREDGVEVGSRFQVLSQPKIEAISNAVTYPLLGKCRVDRVFDGHSECLIDRYQSRDFSRAAWMRGGFVYRPESSASGAEDEEQP